MEYFIFTTVGKLVLVMGFSKAQTLTICEAYELKVFESVPSSIW